MNVDENRRDSEIKSVAGSWHVTDDDVVTHPKRSPVGPLMPEASNPKDGPRDLQGPYSLAPPTIP